jgi:hypothetical protein
VWRFGLASLAYTPDSLRAATDNWPFLYLRQPAIPDLTLRGMGIMGGLALLLILFYLPKERAGFAGISLDGRMFFLGAGFMLVETKAVVHMALLFGATWIVNSVVFFAILLMILAANLLVLWLKPQRLWPLYIGLFTALTLNLIVPLDVFLGLDSGLRAVGSSLLVFGPILFAGMIFALIFSGTASPNRAFGSNIAGAMFGGLTENVSMMLGFQLLLLVAITFYALTAAIPRISVALAGRQSGAPPRPTAATR